MGFEFRNEHHRDARETPERGRTVHKTCSGRMQQVMICVSSRLDEMVKNKGVACYVAKWRRGDGMGY